jgi:hypothetical protein
LLLASLLPSLRGHNGKAMPRSRRIIAAIALMVCFAITGPSAHAQVTAITPRRLTMKTIATVNLLEVAKSAAVQSLQTPAINQSQHATVVNRRIPVASRSGAAIADAQMRAKLLPFPLALSTRFSAPRAPKISGFNGLNALDSAIGQGLDVTNPIVFFGIEPPDQGLCVGNGKLVEMTNLEFAVYDASGNRAQGPLTLNSVFGVPPSDFTSDPKCYYDAPTNRFYMTLTDLTDQITHSSLLIAVMDGNSTTIKAYQIDTTDDGTDNTPAHDGCPCFGDQPLLGADSNAIFLSTNEFSMPNLPLAFNGAQIYLISKSDLAAAAANPRVFPITGGIPLGEDFAASVQPATSPDGDFDTANGGTEFLMGALDFAGTGDNRIAAWAMTNTCILASSACAGPLGFTLTPPILRTPTYMIPPPANQKAGTIPYGDATGNPLEQIDTTDDRMGQLVYAHGKLYTALDTRVRVGGAFQAGIEYFIVKPSFHTKTTPSGPQLIFSARLTRSGYVAHTATDIYYPSIGVTSTGKAVMAFSLSGTNIYPSAGWMPIANAGPQQIHVAAAGAGPDDGITGYPTDNTLGSSVARWGDYSAAVADGENIWMATEYIPSACTDAQYGLDPLCGMTRAPEANWGTYISEFITPMCGQPFNPVPCVPRAGGTP